MLSHYKINDSCIALMLIHRKNNANHCKITDNCIALMLIHCKNNANHCRINDICIALMLIHCKNNAVHCKIDDICTEVPGGAGGPQKDPSRRKAKSDKFTYRKALFLST